MELDYNQDAACQNVDNVNAEEILESNKVQDSEGVHGEVDKEIGAITLELKDVRNAIGHEREDWRNAMDAELQSLRHNGAIHDVVHVPRNEQILPMKMVLTLKPGEGAIRRKKTARICVCGDFQ